MQPSLSIARAHADIYFPDTPIFIRISITNESPHVYRFKLAENRIFNLNVQARTEANQSLAPALSFINARGSQQVFFREVSLEPGEEISFIEELKHYVRIEEEGSYLIRAEFYPELHKEHQGVLQSNTMRIIVRPGVEDHDRIEAEIDLATAESLKKVDLSPDKVVDYLIRARQDSNWNRFFLYLNLEGLLSENLSLQRQYQRSSEEDRMQLLEVFRQQIEDGNIDRDITFVPAEFRILRTEFGPRNGSVLVEEIFEYPQYREIKHYTYRLTRDEYWYVTGYDVMNIGTEARS